MSSMNSIEKLLSVGDMRTTGQSEEVIKQVTANPGLFGDVVDAILVENPGVRMRASDVAEKVTRDNPEWLKPYKNQFLMKIAYIDQKEVRWHAAQILPRLDLTKRERGQVYELMQAYLEDESSIVKTFAMQALADIAMQDRSYVDRVRNQVKRLMQQGSPAMKSRAHKLLVMLDAK